MYLPVVNFASEHVAGVIRVVDDRFLNENFLNIAASAKALTLGYCLFYGEQDSRFAWECNKYSTNLFRSASRF